MTACSHVPSHVIAPDDMAELLADIHIGESVIEQNYADYRTDSAKLAMKLTIYKRHGVTAEDVDTSLIWYGHNLEKYNDVYDRTIEILEDRLAHVQSTEAMEAMAIAGDSVDVWNGARHISVSSASPSQFLSFALDSDENWEPGDVYSWRFKTYNNTGKISLSLLVDYADGIVEQSYSSTADDGWHTVQLSTDTLREAKRIYGFTRLLPTHPGNYLYVDSISLTRNRVNPAAYIQRFRHRKFGQPNIKPAEPNEAHSTNSEPMRVFKAENIVSAPD